VAPSGQIIQARCPKKYRYAKTAVRSRLRVRMRLDNITAK
jgi:hypothetical protein